MHGWPAWAASYASGGDPPIAPVVLAETAAFDLPPRPEYGP